MFTNEVRFSPIYPKGWGGDLTKIPNEFCDASFVPDNCLFNAQPTFRLEISNGLPRDFSSVKLLISALP